VKARAVKKLRPDGTFADGARQIAKVRLDELGSFAPKALDPSNGDDMHDMRIAAKRLRYLLELSEPALGKPALEGAKVARELQDLLGEIHDCEVFIEGLERYAADLRAADVLAAVGNAPDEAEDLDPAALSNGAATRYRGVGRAIAYYEARRLVLHRRFAHRWTELDRNGFRDQLLGELEGV
jgi:CHAD domain-containing protein